MLSDSQRTDSSHSFLPSSLPPFKKKIFMVWYNRLTSHVIRGAMQGSDSSILRGRKLYLGGFHPFLEDALANEVRTVKKDDPFAPVIIFVGSNLLGLSLRRSLAKKLGSIFNVQFKTFLDLARSITSEKMMGEGRNEASFLASRLIIEELLSGGLPLSGSELQYFSEIARYDGFRDAVLGTIEDLKEAGIAHSDFADVVERIKAGDRRTFHKLDELSRLYASYAESLKIRRLYDRTDLLVEACAMAAKQDCPLSAYVCDVREHDVSFFIYGFYDFNFIQKKLLEACMRGAYCCAFFPYKKRKESEYRYAAKAKTWFEEMGFDSVEEEYQENVSGLLGFIRERSLDDTKAGLPVPDHMTHDRSFEIVSAPGEMREVSEIIHRITGLISEGIKFDDIGIIIRDRKEYAPLMQEFFERNDIPFYSSNTHVLSQTREGKSLLLFLSLLDGEFSRRDVMQFLAFTNMDFSKVYVDSWVPSIPEWEAISMRAGIVRGREEWLHKLRIFVEGIRGDDGRHESDDVVNDDHRKKKHAERFLFFVERFFSMIEEIPLQGTWSEISDAVISGFKRFVKATPMLDIIGEALGELKSLDAIRESTTISQYRRFLKEKLESSFVRRGKFQSSSIAVVDLPSVRGIGFKIVIAPGLVEKRFPALIRQDPILLDAERMKINGMFSEQRLSQKMERLEEEKLLFDLLVSSAERNLILSYPRIDPETASERVPSFFLLKAAEAITGEKIDFENIEKLSFFTRSPLSQLFPSEEKQISDEIECNLSLMADAMRQRKKADVYFLSRFSSCFKNALLADRSRWGSKKFTPYDGVFESNEVLTLLKKRHSLGNSPVSASSLEMYAACPFRYFCNKILLLEILEEPEEIMSISPLDKGALLHDILFEFYETLHREGRLPLDSRDLPEYRSLVEKVSRSHFEKMERRGRTGVEMMWKIEQARLLDDLGKMMEKEIENADEYVPAHFEIRFGMPKSETYEGDLSTDEPVKFAVGRKEKFLFKGRIDRIDLSKDGHHGRVIDYKSGAAYHKNDAFMGGTALQLPIYILAAEEIMGRTMADSEKRRETSIAFSDARYFYATRKGNFVTKKFSRECWEEKLDTLGFIVRTIIAGIEKGIFFQTGDEKTCEYCDYAFLCGTAQDIRFERKKDDERIQHHLAMMEIA